MLNKHLIFVVITIFPITFIYASSFIFNVFAVPPDDRFGGQYSSCNSDYSKNTKTCCWRERVPGQILAKTYCQTCDYAGKICKEKVLQFTGPSDLSQFEGNVLEEATPQSDQSRFPTKGGLLGLLDETSPTIQSDENNNIHQKGKGELLGLLDDNLHTFQQQQPLPEFTTPQRSIPNTDLLSKLDNDNLLTSVPPEQTERLNLLEDGQDEESPIKETDRDNDEHILKNDDKEEEEETEEKAEQNNDDTIYCIRAPCPNSNDEQQGQQDEQLSLNQDDDDETQSGEDEKQEQEQLKEAELPPIKTETLTPD